MSYKAPTEKDLEAMIGIVGKQYATNDKAITASYLSKSVMGLESQIPDIVVRPKYVEEVRKVLLYCSDEKIAVSPVSAGLSGGFACPTIKPAGVMLDMSRMDRILEIDEDNRYAVVEPGVTIGRLWAYMHRNHPDWAPPVPDGAPPASTVMGDAIDRGFSLYTSSVGPQGDNFMCAEVVFPNGDIVKTGSWALPGAKPFYKYGIGPDMWSFLMGSQGALGVITKVAVKIYPHPEFKTVIAWGMSNPYDMQDLTLEVQKQEFGIAHNTVMVQGGNYPLVMTRWPKDKVPHNYEFYEKLGISKWWMNFECWAQTQEELDYVTNRIDKMAEDYKKNRAKDPDSINKQQLHPKQIASRLKKPNKIAIPYSFWEAGFLFITWYTPWNECAHFSEMYCEKMEKYGFPPVMWVASIERGRQAICMPIVCFDSTDPKDFEKVQDLNRETTEYGLEQGWLNYRPDPYIHAPLMYSRAGMYWKYLRAFKKLVDPNMIMHPGRLALP
ncbi:MAG: FAD-binding oxidoreductase [Promethearchaeati archaeon]